MLIRGGEVDGVVDLAHETVGVMTYCRDIGGYFGLSTGKGCSGITMSLRR